MRQTSPTCLLPANLVPASITGPHKTQAGALSRYLCICIGLGNEAFKSVMSTAANEAAPGNILHTAHTSAVQSWATLIANSTIIGWKMP